MAIEKSDDTGGEQVADGVTPEDRTAVVGAYTWEDFRREEHTGGQFNKAAYLGYDPEDIGDRLEKAASNALTVNTPFAAYIDPERTPVVLGTYSCDHFKQEFYY